MSATVHARSCAVLAWGRASWRYSIVACTAEATRMPRRSYKSHSMMRCRGSGHSSSPTSMRITGVVCVRSPSRGPPTAVGPRLSPDTRAIARPRRAASRPRGDAHGDRRPLARPSPRARPGHDVHSDPGVGGRLVSCGWSTLGGALATQPPVTPAAQRLDQSRRDDGEAGRRHELRRLPGAPRQPRCRARGGFLRPGHEA